MSAVQLFPRRLVRPGLRGLGEELRPEQRFTAAFREIAEAGAPALERALAARRRRPTDEVEELDLEEGEGSPLLGGLLLVGAVAAGGLALWGLMGGKGKRRRRRRR